MESKEVRKLKEKAAKYIERHKLKKALKVYLELLKLECRDAALHMKAGDLHRRLDRDDDAVRLYSRAAELYAKDGMLIQGMAACKVILDIDREHCGTQELLADLYTRKYGALPKKRDSEGGSADHMEDPMEDTSETLPKHEVPEIEIEVNFDTELKGEAEIMVEDDVDSLVGNGEEAVPSRSSTPSLEADFEEEIELTFEEEIPNPSFDELPRIPLFSDLDRESFIDLLNRVPLRRYAPDELIVSEGDQGESFFVLVSGKVRVWKGPDIQIAQLNPGAFFGEIALVVNRPRRASVQAIDDCQALEISKSELDRLDARYPHIAEVLRGFAEQRLLHNLMLTSPLFTPFTTDEKMDLVRRFTPEFHGADQDIITQGEPSSGLFLIASGAADVLRRQETGALDTIATLSEGDICGELSLMTRDPAVATVRTVQETRVLKLPRDAFGEIIMTHPQILMLMSELSDARSWEARDGLARPLVTTNEGGSALL